MFIQQNVIDVFFYYWPNDPKPPGSFLPIFDKENNPLAVELQFALAGFKKEDLKIWNEGHTLRIQGSNITRQDITDKFKCNIDRSIALKEAMDVERAKVSLDEGILRIHIPVEEKAKEKRFLLGGQ